ncbi:hypothetical protein SUGI_0734770 [Cryptomeria japonica]|nr:hypothetical protein SUGI_0734770 [Cryptomeria japonica]
MSKLQKLYCFERDCVPRELKIFLSSLANLEALKDGSGFEEGRNASKAEVEDKSDTTKGVQVDPSGIPQFDVS